MTTCKTCGIPIPDYWKPRCEACEWKSIEAETEKEPGKKVAGRKAKPKRIRGVGRVIDAGLFDVG